MPGSITYNGISPKCPAVMEHYLILLTQVTVIGNPMCVNGPFLYTTQHIYSTTTVCASILSQLNAFL